MILYICDKDDGEVKSIVNGSLQDLCAESLLLLRVLYTRIKEKDPEAAQVYKDICISSVSEDGPIFGEEDDHKDNDTGDEFMEYTKSVFEKLMKENKD